MKKIPTKILSLLTATTILTNTAPQSFAVKATNPNNYDVINALLTAALEQSFDNSTGSNQSPSALVPYANNANANNASSTFSLIQKFASIAGYIGLIEKGSNLIVSILYHSGAFASRYLITTNGFNDNRMEIYIKLNEVFENTVKGQSDVQESITGEIIRFLDYLEQKKNNPSNLKKSGHIIYLIGESGTGKSICAEAIANAIMKNPKNKFMISPASISKNEKGIANVKEQLFMLSDSIRYNFGGKDSRQLQSQSITNHIYKNPSTVVIINEYDKLFDKDLEEQFRTILDEGTIHISNSTMDCDSVLFIITSNEGKDSFPSKFPKVKAKKSNSTEESQKENINDSVSENIDIQTEQKEESKKENQNENKSENSDVVSVLLENGAELGEKNNSKGNEESNKNNNSNPTNTNDLSEDAKLHGTTKREHAASFVNRLSIIPFNRLSKDSLEEIAEDFILKEIEFKKKEEFGINLIFEKALFEKIASFAKDANEGARAITFGLKIPFDRAINPFIFKGQFGTFKLDFYEGENKEPVFTLTRTYSKENIDKTIELAEKILSNPNHAKEIFNNIEFQGLIESLEQIKNIQSEEQFENNIKYIEKVQELILKAKMRDESNQKAKNKSWLHKIFSIFN